MIDAFLFVVRLAGLADVEEFRKSGSVGPIDQSPFAQRLDEAVGNHELGCGNGAGVHAEGLEHGCETQILPSFEGEEFGPEFHDIAGLDEIENNALDGGLGNWLGDLRASCELNATMSEY